MTIRQKPFFLLLVAGYCIAAIALFFFSYTQVDLSLTLSRVSIVQTIQKTFQYVGYWQRPIATFWFAGVVSFYSILYVASFLAAYTRRITVRSVWILVGITSLLLVLSYPAFSYDIFNYMFYVKEIFVYHKNPFLVTPLQFTGVEPWLSFMHWTHVSSPYTPLWILLSIPSYLFGFGYFLWILWNFKLLAVGFYLVTALFIGKIARLQDSKSVGASIVIFALNPLVIIEILVSGHNDIAMMAFAVMAIYFYQTKRKILSYFLLALSVATKLMTIFLYPTFLIRYKRMFALFSMCIGLILVLTTREMLSWYFIWILPFVALVPQNRFIVSTSAGISLGLVLRYAPFFYYGHWNNPVPSIKLWVTIVPIGIALVYSICTAIVRRSDSR